MSRTTYKTAPKAGLYTRLSVDDGITDKESNSITSQKQMLMQYAQYHGIEVAEIYVDDGWSGTNFERPDFKRMIEDIESGKINTVITKDLSRLGRDYLQTGYYTEVYFPSKKVRYIAISDGIDTSMGYNEMAPFKNLFNDFYARDISKKIRSTMTTKARAGIYHSTVPPFGYRKSPEDSHKLIPDAETAPIVRRMYELAVQGKGYKAIGNVLKRERIPIPAYWHHIRGERTWAGFKGEGDISNYIWNETTIKWILSHEVYIGSLVAQKQSKLFKVGKNYVKPKDEWVVVKDIFEPIVDLELWERVQEVNGKRRRMCKATREPGIFSGIAYCPDCGRRISFFPEKTSKNSDKKTYFGSCLSYKANGRDGCTPHRIKEQDLYDTVLKDIREWASMALADEQAVLDKVMEQQQTNSTIDYGLIEGKKRTIGKRLEEIDKVISKLYEDYALGRLAGTSIDNLMPKYQKEQEELKKQLSALQEQSAEHDSTEQNAEKWISLIRQYSDLQELNSCIINELITKILVGDKRKVNGEKVQSIEIHYRFIGNLTDGGMEQVNKKSS